MRSLWNKCARRAAVVLATTALAAGCASAPSEFYTLDMRPSGMAKPTVNITVGTILVAESLAEKNLLVQKSPTQIEYYAVGQWAGNIDQLLQEKLTAELGPTLPNARTMVLTGSLTAFEQVDTANGANAHLKLEAELRDAGKSHYAPALLKKTYDISVPDKAPGANETATALSRCVEQLAAQLAADAAKI